MCRKYWFEGYRPKSQGGTNNVLQVRTQPINLDFYVRSEEVAISAANYNYNHYDLPFSHIVLIVIISDEDMLNYLTLETSSQFSG